MRLSIRYQILALFSVIIVAALGTYLSLASSLFTADKLAYLYDFNSGLANTLSEEVHANLSGLVDKLHYYGAEQSYAATQGGDRTRPARSLFATDPDVLALEVWERDASGQFARTVRHLEQARLDGLDVTAEDVIESLRQFPAPLEEVRREGVLLENVSLPPDFAAMRLSAASGDGSRVVVATLRPDRFLRIFVKSKLPQVSLVDGRGRVVVHADQPQVIARTDASEDPVVAAALEGKVRRGVHEVKTARGEVIGAFSSVGLGRLSVIVEVPKAQALRASEELVRRSLLFGVLVLMVALVASLFFSRRLSAPLQRLERTMATISTGRLGVEVPVNGDNEIARLARAFNRMSHELSARELKLVETTAQLMQSEKMSALGEMSAGLAHEVKNPMVGIVGFSELGGDAQSLAEARELFALIHSDARRANDILQRLLEYARPEEVEFERLQLNEVVQGAVRLVKHQLELGDVRLEESYADALPPISGNNNLLRQVLVNLMMNAGHAMEATARKTLWITTANHAGALVIELRDTGEGMSEDVRLKLFRPFFTTKERGKGTGLGLSVSRSIIAQHHGDITVESAPDQGATFRILLPAMESEAGLRPAAEELPTAV